MSLVRALATRLVLNQRKLQEELDVWRLYHLAHYWQACGGKEVRVNRPEEVPYTKQYRVVHSAVTAQVVKLLQSALSSTVGGGCHGTDSSTDPHFSELSPPDGVAPANSLPFRLSLIKQPSVAKPIPGVKLEGHAVPGTVVCLFPGRVYLPPHVKQMPNYPDLSLDNPYLMSRTDGSIIDAKHYQLQEERENLFAVGHLVRHPMEGQQPNAMPFSYEVDPKFPSDLLPLLPNKYFKRPGFLYSTKSPMRALVFVAMTHIKDQELLLNYRLHPNTELPEWYSTMDKTEDKRRWKY